MIAPAALPCTCAADDVLPLVEQLQRLGVSQINIIVNIHVHVDTPAQQPAAPAPVVRAARHSNDYRSVHWFGTDYTFTPMQAAIIRQLWEAWERGIPGVGGDYLLEIADSEAEHVGDLFRHHPAWHTMIVTEARLYRLQEPPAAILDYRPDAPPTELAPVNPLIPGGESCEADILLTLREAGQRLTTSQLLREMEARGRLWGESTTKHNLARLVKERRIDNNPTTNPRGYGIVTK